MKVGVFVVESSTQEPGKKLWANKDVVPPGPSQIDQGRRQGKASTHLHNSEISDRDSPAEKGASACLSQQLYLRNVLIAATI
jgi:hypothetical protein